MAPSSSPLRIACHPRQRRRSASADAARSERHRRQHRTGRLGRRSSPRLGSPVDDSRGSGGEDAACPRRPGRNPGRAGRRVGRCGDLARRRTWGGCSWGGGLRRARGGPVARRFAHSDGRGCVPSCPRGGGRRRHPSRKRPLHVHDLQPGSVHGNHIRPEHIRDRPGRGDHPHGEHRLQPMEPPSRLPGGHGTRGRCSDDQCRHPLRSRRDRDSHVTCRARGSRHC